MAQAIRWRSAERAGATSKEKSRPARRGTAPVGSGGAAGLVGRAIAAFVHELVELRLVARLAQPLQVVLELLLLLLQAAERFGAVVVERLVAARLGPKPSAALAAARPA